MSDYEVKISTVRHVLVLDVADEETAVKYAKEHAEGDTYECTLIATPEALEVSKRHADYTSEP